MKTIYLLIVITHGQYWVPGPEFKVQAECEAVALQFDPHPQGPGFFDHKKKARCLVIKKTL